MPTDRRNQPLEKKWLDNVTLFFTDKARLFKLYGAIASIAFVSLVSFQIPLISSLIGPFIGGFITIRSLVWLRKARLTPEAVQEGFTDNEKRVILLATLTSAISYFFLPLVVFEISLIAAAGTVGYLYVEERIINHAHRHTEALKAFLAEMSSAEDSDQALTDGEKKLLDDLIDNGADMLAILNKQDDNYRINSSNRSEKVKSLESFVIEKLLQKNDRLTFYKTMIGAWSLFKEKFKAEETYNEFVTKLRNEDKKSPSEEQNNSNAIYGLWKQFDIAGTAFINHWQAYLRHISPNVKAEVHFPWQNVLHVSLKVAKLSLKALQGTLNLFLSEAEAPSVQAQNEDVQGAPLAESDVEPNTRAAGTSGVEILRAFRAEQARRQQEEAQQQQEQELPSQAPRRSPSPQ